MDGEEIRQVPVPPERSGMVMMRPVRPAVGLPGKRSPRYPRAPEVAGVLGTSGERSRFGGTGGEPLVRGRGVRSVVVPERHEHVASVSRHPDVANLREVRQRVQREVALHEAPMLLALEPLEHGFKGM